MTNEEAISDLKNLYGDGSCEYVMRPLRTEVIKLAIEAFEKQIPKKPILESDDTFEKYACECGKVLGIKGERMILGGGKTFCVRCGQKIDWGEEDDE